MAAEWVIAATLFVEPAADPATLETIFTMNWSIWSSPCFFRNLLPLRGSRLLHEGGDERRRREAGLQLALFVEKLFAPAPVTREDFAKSGAARNLNYPLVEFVHRSESFGVPGRDLAEHPAAV